MLGADPYRPESGVPADIPAARRLMMAPCYADLTRDVSPPDPSLALHLITAPTSDDRAPIGWLGGMASGDDPSAWRAVYSRRFAPRPEGNAPKKERYSLLLADDPVEQHLADRRPPGEPEPHINLGSLRWDPARAIGALLPILSALQSAPAIELRWTGRVMPNGSPADVAVSHSVLLALADIAAARQIPFSLAVPPAAMLDPFVVATAERRLAAAHTPLALRSTPAGSVAGAAILGLPWGALRYYDRDREAASILDPIAPDFADGITHPLAVATTDDAAGRSGFDRLVSLLVASRSAPSGSA